MSKIKIALAGSLLLIALLGVSNLWFFTLITSLQADKNSLTSQVNDLQTQLDQKNHQIQTLQNQVNDLQTQLDQKNHQIQTLQNQVNDLSNQTDTLNQSYLALNQTYTELLRQYEDLLFHFNLLNNPASNFTTVNDLNITLAVHHTTYYYKDPVSGNVTITYLNGTAFKGIFVIYVLPQFGRHGMTTYSGLEINGFTEFYISSPVFLYGPGNYTIGISNLYTADGYMIESRWAIFPSVTVEAK